MIMSRIYEPAYGGYGAFELKATYQRNMLMGMGITALFAAFVIGAVLVAQLLAGPPDEKIEPPGKRRYLMDTVAVRIDRQPSIKKGGTRPSVNRRLPSNSNVGSKPILLPDSLIGEQPDGMFLSNLDKAEYGPVEGFNYNGTDPGYGGDYAGGGGGGDDYPAPYQFQENVQEPKMIQEVVPEFPRLALEAGLNGYVWVRVLIDEEGKVIDAFVEKSSSKNAGFEEAALKAARKCLFSPGIQNGRPLKVWVSFKFEFDLARSN